MAITYLTPTIVGDMTLVRVSSDLVGTVYFHWYQDGSYVGLTMVGQKGFRLSAGSEAEIVCQDTLDPAYDPVAAAPSGYPAVATLELVSSTDADIARYRLEQSQDGGAWVTIAYIEDDGDWWWTFATERLDDLSTYAWRAVPIDLVGNDGTPKVLGTMRVVRRPSAVRWARAFDSVANRMTFSEVT
jgi:hypothetical protein